MSEIKTTKSGTVIKLKSNLTSDKVEELKENIIGLLRDGSQKITLDMANVQAIDAKGLALLVGAFKSIERDEGIFKLKNVVKKIWPVFEYSRLERYFEIAPKK